VIDTDWKPVVGQECEYSREITGDWVKWRRCIFIGTVNGEHFFLDVNNFLNRVDGTNRFVKFRPIKTQEDKEREEFANEAIKRFNCDKIKDIDLITCMYDAGYRKLEEGQKIVSPLTEKQRSNISKNLRRSLIVEDRFMVNTVLEELGLDV